MMRSSNIYDLDFSSNLKSTNQTDNLKVVIRVRPALPREMEQDLPFRSIVRMFFIFKAKFINSLIGDNLNFLLFFIIA